MGMLACVSRVYKLERGTTPVEYIGHVDLLGMIVDKDSLFR